MSSASSSETSLCTVYLTCPECDVAVPVTVEVSVIACGCGQHEALGFLPDFTDVEMHVLLHEEAS